MLRLKHILWCFIVVFIGIIVFSGIAVAQGQSGTTLSADKTASGHMEREFKWTIDKSVEPGSWDLFVGDTGTSKYTISVTKDEGTDKYFVSGEICVTNGGSFATENLTIIDEVQYKVGSGQFQTLTTADVDLGSYSVLEAGASHCYPYKVVFTPVEGAVYRNVAHITITNHAGWIPGGNNCPGPDLCPFGPNPKTDFSLPTSPDILINNTINVDDTNGDGWSFSASGSVNYDKTFSCGQIGKNVYDNTATVRETGQSDSANVTVNCYKLDVSKTAATSYDRTFNWIIDKVSVSSELTLATGEQLPAAYSIILNNSSTDSNWKAGGIITINNPAPIAATINSISDIVSPDIAASIDCQVTLPYELAAGEKLECVYIVNLPDALRRTNTATVVLQSYSYDPVGNRNKITTSDYTATAAVVFGNPNLIDECITVSDTYAGGLGKVCNTDTLPKTINYNRNIGPYADCGEYTIDNTASFITDDTSTTGSSSWLLAVHVPCEGGCTLTQGYWKTHSKKGPAPYDDNWKNLSSLEEDTVFFLSGKTYYQVLWTPPQGNVYYILAHQYIAAKLNVLNGASDTAVKDAITQAEKFFNTYTPAAAAKISKSYKAELTVLYTLLDNYNNGLIGPGHCSE